MATNKRTGPTKARKVASFAASPTEVIGSEADLSHIPTVTEAVPSRGRPEGAKTIKVEAIVETSRCPHCGSTERERYANTTEMEFSGERNGQPFTHIVWRSTRCLGCGQSRRDKTFENRFEVFEPVSEIRQTVSSDDTVPEVADAG